MPLSQARALVPGLEVADADPEGDAAFLHRLALFAACRWTPRAALSPPDGLFLDLTGVSHLFGGERAACIHFVRFIARLGFTARIAVAGTWGAAHALARFSEEPVTLCPNGGEADALAPLPLAALRLGEEALGAARRLGLETVGELIAMPRAPLQRRFGRALVERLDQALGRASEAVDPVVPEEAPAAELRFAEPVASPEAIAEALIRLVQGLVGTLAKRGLGARRVDWLCLRVDGAGQELAIGTARATRDATHLQRLLLPKVEEIDPGFGIEAMRLVAARAEPLAPQTVEGALAGDKPAPDLSLLVDRLAGRLGARRLFRVGAVESDVPERGVRRLPPFAQPDEWPRWPRPVRMLSPPERVENVVALLPDQPPRRFTWRGRAYQVRAADGPERIHGEWWRARAEADAVRDYFQVEDEEGARFWLFRRGNGTDPRTGDLSWYLHGMFG
ncbi:MAG: protein ImuB [Sphingomonadales bacterium]|jgi:protein ImuB|nr:protein ImuB [Sphingomonadales bacterium]